jgi:acetyl esterase/lipase
MTAGTLCNGYSLDIFVFNPQRSPKLIPPPQAAANATSLSANPSAGFIVGGTSAGGNLSAVMLYLARDAPLSPPLTGAFLSVPAVLHEAAVPSKYSSGYLSMQQNAHAPVVNYDAVQILYNLYKPDVKSPLFVPFNHPKGHKGLPPVYFQICGLDPLRDDGLLYEKALREEAGVKTRLDLYPGLPHAFWAVFPHLSSSPAVAVDTLQGVSWLLQEGKSFAK